MQETEFPPGLVDKWVRQTMRISVPRELVDSRQIFAVPRGSLQGFLDFYAGAGQIKDDANLDPARLANDSLIPEINDFDHAPVEQQARDYR